MTQQTQKAQTPQQPTRTSEKALATQGERHAKCGRMVAYGELHWTDECKPKV